MTRYLHKRRTAKGVFTVAMSWKRLDEIYLRDCTNPMNFFSPPSVPFCFLSRFPRGCPGTTVRRPSSSAPSRCRSIRLSRRGRARRRPPATPPCPGSPRGCSPASCRRGLSRTTTVPRRRPPSWAAAGAGTAACRQSAPRATPLRDRARRRPALTTPCRWDPRKSVPRAACSGAFRSRTPRPK